MHSYRKLSAGIDLDIGFWETPKLPFWLTDSRWLLDVLLGHGLAEKETRQKIGQAVAHFLVVAIRLRARTMKQAMIA